MKRGNSAVPFKELGSSPAKQTDTTNVKKDTVVIDGKTYPKGYTKKDVEFLKKQKEDVVRREDLDEAGKKIYDARREFKPAKKKK